MSPVTLERLENFRAIIMACISDWSSHWRWRFSTPHISETTRPIFMKLEIYNLVVGFGLAALCGQLCIFGQYSASAEGENYFFGQTFGFGHFLWSYSALAEGDSATIHLYILGVTCTGQYNTPQSSLLILLCCHKTLLWSGVRATWGLHDDTYML